MVKEGVPSWGMWHEPGGFQEWLLWGRDTQTKVRRKELSRQKEHCVQEHMGGGGLQMEETESALARMERRSAEQRRAGPLRIRFSLSLPPSLPSALPPFLSPPPSLSLSLLPSRSQFLTETIRGSYVVKNMIIFEVWKSDLARENDVKVQDIEYTDYS